MNINHSSAGKNIHYSAQEIYDLMEVARKEKCVNELEDLIYKSFVNYPRNANSCNGYVDMILNKKIWITETEKGTKS